MPAKSRKLKPCPKGYVRNPKTNRCIKKTSLAYYKLCCARKSTTNAPVVSRGSKAANVMRRKVGGRIKQGTVRALMVRGKQGATRATRMTRARVPAGKPVRAIMIDRGKRV